MSHWRRRQCACEMHGGSMALCPGATNREEWRLARPASHTCVMCTKQRAESRQRKGQLHVKASCWARKNLKTMNGWNAKIEYTFFQFNRKWRNCLFKTETHTYGDRAPQPKCPELPAWSTWRIAEMEPHMAGIMNTTVHYWLLVVSPRKHSSHWIIIIIRPFHSIIAMFHRPTELANWMNAYCAAYYTLIASCFKNGIECLLKMFRIMNSQAYIIESLKMPMFWCHTNIENICLKVNRYYRKNTKQCRRMNMPQWTMLLNRNWIILTEKVQKVKRKINKNECRMKRVHARSNICLKWIAYPLTI